MGMKMQTHGVALKQSYIFRKGLLFPQSSTYLTMEIKGRVYPYSAS